MFRTFLISSRRLLVPRPIPALTFTPDTSDVSSGVTTIYDVRRNGHIKEYHRPLLTLPSQLQLHPLLGQSNLLKNQSVRWASGKKGFQMPDPTQITCNMINMLKCVDLNDLKDAPPEAFWLAMLVGGSQIVVPFLEIVGGYSPVLTLYQLNVAALSLGFFGGMKWGLALSSNPVPTASWETMRWCLLPPFIAVLGLLLPYPLGFLTIAGGMITSLYLDLISCAYPPWACATALFITLTTVIGLLLALSAYVLFHNREKNKNKKVKDEEVDDEVEGPPPGEEGEPFEEKDVEKAQNKK